MTLEGLGSKCGELDRTRGLAHRVREAPEAPRARRRSLRGDLPDALDALSGEEGRLYGMLRLEVAPTQGAWRLPVLLVLLANRR